MIHASDAPEIKYKLFTNFRQSKKTPLGQFSINTAKGRLQIETRHSECKGKNYSRELASIKRWQ
jgi:hypothetical protein